MMTKYSEDFTTQEMIVVAGSRSLPDNKVIFAGTGLPMVAITIAQLTHGPGIVPWSAPFRRGFQNHVPGQLLAGLEFCL